MTRGIGLVWVVALACGKPPATPVEPVPSVSNTPADAATEAQMRAPATAAGPTPSAGAITLPSGAILDKQKTVDTGASPQPNDRVKTKVGKRGDTTDASVTDRPLREHPPELGEALARMRVGERALVWLPTVTAAGGAGEPIVVEIELVGIRAAPPVPPDVGAPPAKAPASKLGVARRTIRGGGGRRARSFDELVIAYTVWSREGVLLWSTTFDDPPTVTIAADRLGPGFLEAITAMRTGETARLWIPAAQTGALGTAAGASDLDLTVDVELVDVHPRPAPPSAPKDVKRPPKSAKQTAKGVRYRYLVRGKGKSKDRPTETSRVKVHYSGWTTDGKMFDSSITRGAPAVFPLAGVIPGWTDVLQVMVPGDRIRAWIPEDLAYKGRAGTPQGMLVFDIELIEIVP